MKTAEAILLALQSPQAGREADHRQWYLATHLPDVCAVDGVVRGEFTAAVSAAESPQWSHAAVYWLRQDPGQVLDEVLRRARGGEMELSDTLDAGRTMMGLAEALTPRRMAAGRLDPDPRDRWLYIVMSDPKPGEDEAFNRWYSNVHLPDVLTVPGFVAAQRFRFLDHPALAPCPHRYLAIYEVLAEVAPGAFAELRARAGTERMVLSPALDAATVYAAAFAPEGVCAGSA